MKNLTLDFGINCLGYNIEEIKWLVEALNTVPKKLVNLKVDLIYNSLGHDSVNLRLLGEGMG